MSQTDDTLIIFHQVVIFTRALQEIKILGFTLQVKMELI